MFILPFYSVDSYTISKNTTSHLGAQNESHAWIMNVTFVLLALTSIISGWKFYQGLWFHRVVLIIFGISLICAAYFQHGPIDPGIKYDIMEDNLHSLFSSITGFSFVALAISTAFIVEFKREKLIALIIATSAIIFSVLMFKIEDLMGIWQRIIFISSFGWMIHLFQIRRN